MAGQDSLLFNIFLVSSFLVIGSKACNAGESNGTIQFSYMGSTGPGNWGSLSPKFSACSTGKSQSPIDIVTKEAALDKKLQPLRRDYNPSNASLVNNGFNVGLRYAPNSGVLVTDGKKYTLKQMHWHAPSEHRLDGVQYDAELHLVHLADDGSVSVVAMLYQYGHADPLISKIQNKLKELSKEVCSSNEVAQITVEAETVDTKQLRKNTRKYYRYVGSFTTPPCTENVVWHILGKVRSIAKEQVDALKAPLDLSYKNNSRPVQPLNGRKIELYEELAN